MRVKITSITAEIYDVSTNTEEDYMIANWNVEYEVHFPITPIYSASHTIKGRLQWAKDDVNLQEIIQCIEETIKGE